MKKQQKIKVFSQKSEKEFFNKVMKSKAAQESYAEAEAFYEFVEQVKTAMKKEHLTYYKVAKKAGIHHQVLARLLNGSENAELKTLFKVANGLGAKLHLELVFENR